MIVVRNVFRLKFGQARPALAAWKEGFEIMKRAGMKGSPRLLTDLVGPSYTLVMESTYESLTAFEREAGSVMGNEDWKKWYAKFVPLVDSGYREVYNIVE
jgi:hypothetical protein